MPDVDTALADAIKPHRDGAVVCVYVQPRASRTGFVGLHGARVKIALKAPPVDGKANAELVRFLAGALGVRKSDVRVAKGESSRRKVVLVEGATVAALREALDGALAPS